MSLTQANPFGLDSWFPFPPLGQSCLDGGYVCVLTDRPERHGRCRRTKRQWRAEPLGGNVRSGPAGKCELVVAAKVRASHEHLGSAGAHLFSLA